MRAKGSAQGPVLRFRARPHPVGAGKQFRIQPLGSGGKSLRPGRARDHHGCRIVRNVIYLSAKQSQVPHPGSAGDRAYILHVPVDDAVARCCIPERKADGAIIFVQSPSPAIQRMREITENLSRIPLEKRLSVSSEAETAAVEIAAERIDPPFLHEESLELFSLAIAEHHLAVTAYRGAFFRCFFGVQMASGQMMGVRRSADIGPRSGFG